MHVFGHRLGRESADFLEGGAPEHRRAATVHRRTQGILARLNHVEEELLLLPGSAVFPIRGVLEGIEIVEILVDLHDGHFLLLEEAQQALDEVGLRHVVGVQCDDELSGAVGQRVIQVAGLGVGTLSASQIAAVELLGQRANVGAVAVIQNPGGMGIAHADGADHRVTQQGNRLVVGRDEDVDGTTRQGRFRIVIPPAPRGQIEERTSPNPISSAARNSQKNQTTAGFMVSVIRQAKYLSDATRASRTAIRIGQDVPAGLWWDVNEDTGSIW